MVKAIKGNFGQIQTVEAITAAIILLSVIALVIEATSVTPLTSSFTNQHVKLELQNMGIDVLNSLDETPFINTTNMNSTPSLLKQSVVQWIRVYNCDWYAWNGTEYNSLTNTTHPNFKTALGDTLSYLGSKYGIVFNVEVRYSDTNGIVRNAKMIWNGDPSDNSVSISKIIVLHDDDHLPDGSIIKNISDTKLYNTVELILTFWVM